GYHITALNGIQAAILCDAPVETAPWRMLPSWMLPYVGTLKGCVPMKSSRFGVIVALFTAGGLLGSVSASQITPMIGRVGTLRLASTLCLLGSLFLAISNTTNDMIFSRLLVGIGCGFSTVTVPLYLTELAPSLRNNLGILNQLAMVLGLIFAQSLSLLFSRQFAWRYVLAIATAFSACLLALSFFVADVKPEESKSATGDEERPLLGEAVLAEREREREHMSIGMVFTSDKKEIRRGCESDLAYWSDTSGLICSTRHYRHPDCSADLRYLPRCLLQHEHPSTRLSGECCPTAEATSLFGLALGLNLDLPAVSAVCLIGFILAFGLGTGPVTWVVLSEVLPPGARTAGGSVGVSLNAVTSFVVSSTFLPLQEWLEGDRGADGERSGEGNVFFVFAAFCVASLIAVRWSYGSYERAVLESVRS
ncbi:transporter-domain-containing protein, partial [Dioszegia hungarica]